MSAETPRERVTYPDLRDLDSLRDQAFRLGRAASAAAGTRSLPDAELAALRERARQVAAIASRIARRRSNRRIERQRRERIRDPWETPPESAP